MKISIGWRKFRHNLDGLLLFLDRLKIFIKILGYSTGDKKLGNVFVALIFFL